MLGMAAVGLMLLSAGCARTSKGRSALEAQAASVAYANQQYDDCSRLYRATGDLAEGRAKADYAYSAGTCELRKGRRAEAIEAFRKAMQTHASYCDDIVTDEEIRQALSNDGEWKGVLATFQPAYEAFLSSINSELRQMYLDDQHDREGGPDKIDWSVVNGRDASRRDRVRQFAEAGRLRAADDYYYAAMIFQHGDDEASYSQAFQYAARAVELDSSFVKARWLAAASRDRYHMVRGEPQLYGTQYKRIDGKWWLWPVDFHVTDADRAEWGVEPLETARKRLEKMNAKTK